MACIWMRRAALVLAAGAAVLLAACGSGTIESQLQPSRVIAFGDAFSDVGQGGTRYTVNDGTVNIWSEDTALNFGLPLGKAVSGGTGYARANARVVEKPDAAGNAATPTIKEQVDAFLAAGAPGANDLLLISGGISDIVAQMALVTAGTETSDQMVANAKQAGRDLAAQAKRLVAAGATHVVVIGVYNLGRSPWATGIARTDLLSEASSKFNEELLVALVDQGSNMLYVDAALFFNLMIGNPATYGFTNVTDPVCTSVDPTAGIGIGAGQLNSGLCSTSTLVAGADYNAYLFADRIYPTPQGHRKFGEYTFSRIRSRW